jgi:hypothetical protein
MAQCTALSPIKQKNTFITMKEKVRDTHVLAKQCGVQIKKPVAESGHAEAAVGEALASFMWAYFMGDVRPEADETCRITVGHFRVHLTVWTLRMG